MVKVIRASVFVLLLACPAQAGWIQNEAPAPPPPPPASATQEPGDGATLNGTMHTPPEPDSLTQFALELLTALL